MILINNKSLQQAELNIERVAKVLFACNNQDDLISLEEDDFKLLDGNGEVTCKYDENIFIHLAKKQSGDKPSGVGRTSWIDFFPDELKDNLDFFMKIASSMTHFNGDFLSVASQKILNNKNFAKAVVQNHSLDGWEWESVLKYFSKDVCNNREIVLSAVKKHGRDLEYASDILKNDREVVLAAIKSSDMKDRQYFSSVARFISPLLLNDFEIARFAVNCSGTDLQYFSQEIKKEKDIVRIAVKADKRALEFSDKILLSDKGFILSLPELSFDPAGCKHGIYFYLADNLKKDRDIVMKAISKDIEIYHDLPKIIKEDLLIFSEALKANSTIQNHHKLAKNAPKNIFEDLSTCKKIISKNISYLKYLPKSMQQNKSIKSFLTKLESKNYTEFDGDDLIIFLQYYLGWKPGLGYVFLDEEMTQKVLRKIKTVEGAITLLRKSPKLFQFLDEKLKADKAVQLAILEIDLLQNNIGSNIQYVSKEILRDRVYVENLLSKNGLLMEYLPLDLKNDKRLAEIAIKQNSASFEYLSKELQDDDTIINQAILLSSQRNNMEMIEFASDRFKKNISIANELSKRGYVISEFRNNKSIVLNALKYNNCAEIGDAWDFDIDVACRKLRTSPFLGGVQYDGWYFADNMQVMGLQFLMAINNNKRSRDLLENIYHFFDVLGYDFIIDNNLGDEYDDEDY